ncbi:IS110 family transposase [Pseudonocardia halophobica]|uniref:IS110 family transposase n=1 Tax=Pseudonocardia halophobica TaxID=29401 RepID=UPI003D91AE2E
MTVFCGIDWADDHHDIALVDDSGRVLHQQRIGDDVDGWNQLLEALAAHGDSADAPIPVAIETTRGLLVSCLRATGRAVYAINPLAVARYRDRHSVARRKSDAGDALVLANILRTDLHAHRPLPDDSDQVRAIAVLARAQQDAVWDRVIAHNRLRSLLHEYFPAMLAAFAGKRGGLMRPEARKLLAAAPTPTAAARLTITQLVAVLRRAGRVRQLAAGAARLQAVLRADYLHQPAVVEQAMGVHALALLALLDAACDNADQLAEAAAQAFRAHPDAAIITSFPGQGELTGARILGEIGDDRARFVDARALKAYAGSAPITRASGRVRSVTTRRIKNQRLAAAGYVWAFSSLTASAGARAHYDRRRARGDAHVAAQRNLFNRLLGCLHHCLITGTPYDESTAFPAPTQRLEPAAA